jgi:hypothetical protein
MNFDEKLKSLKLLIRIEKNVEFIGKLEDINKIKRMMNKVLDLVKDTKIEIDKNGKVLPGLIMDEVTK